MMKVVKGAGAIEGIQILRGVAALMVVMHHARHSVPGSEGWPSFGDTGVDIFFVISGFVMAYTTRSLSMASTAGERLDASGEFLRKRLARVVPLYWLVLLWTARRDLAQGRFSIDLIKDFAFLPHPNATYPDMLWPTVVQGWTLNYEMFFYGLFAVSLLFGGLRTRMLLGALLGLVVFGYCLALARWPSDSAGWLGIARRFYTDNIVLEFGYGVLLQRFVAGRPAPAWPRAVFVLVALGGFLLLALGHDSWPRGVMQGLPALLIVWASLHACTGWHLPVLVRLGDASYAIYLFHWASFGAIKPLAAWLGPSGGQPLQVALMMALHFLVAVLSGLAIHRWIEMPMLGWTQARLGLRRRPLGTGAPA